MKSKTIYKIGMMVLLGILIFSACKKDDYINDGGKILTGRVNMTTYDYLKSNPKFDSLVKIIDKAGMKDQVNGNITFFATTNYGAADYVSAKKQEKIVQVGNENIKFTIADLNPVELRDSLKIYMFSGKITRNQLNTEGRLFNSLLGPMNGVTWLIKLRRTNDFSQYVDYVDYLNFTKVIGTRDDLEADPTTIPQDRRDISYDCQTSNIITTTGILHVLDNRHRLFFNAGKLAGN
jgi:hypothetical protein